MDEVTLEQNTAFERLRANLREVVQRLLATDPRTLR
jgi:uncharacterized coiled-coil protein SlyX